MKRLGVRLPIHARGIHYAFVASNDVVCPWNGATYTNRFKCWESLNEPINAARWLGYIAWSDIVDERNAPPETRSRQRPRGRSSEYSSTSISKFQTTPSPSSTSPISRCGSPTSST